MTYLLDTTAFSALMRREAKTHARLSALASTDRAVICTITRGEVLYGLELLPKRWYQGSYLTDKETLSSSTESSGLTPIRHSRERSWAWTMRA